MSDLLSKPIEYLKGVGPLKGDLLKKELQIFHTGDLLLHFPFRYIDRSKFHKIADIESDETYIQVRGIFRNFHEVGQNRGKRLTAILSDDTGNIEVVWFQGASWIKNNIKPGVEYVVFCKPSYFNNRINLVHPELEIATQAHFEKTSGLQPIYPSTEKLKAKGLDSRGFLKLQQTLFQELKPADIPEIFPKYIMEKYRFLNRYEAIGNTHFPKDENILQKARARIKFEEFFVIQLRMLFQKQTKKESSSGFVLQNINNKFQYFYEHCIKQYLGYDLTQDQKDVIRDIRKDVLSGKQMNRLLQGDVGSGKTLVALLSMLMANDNGLQACIMAPTEILAQQHFETIRSYIADMPLKVALLTGSVKGKERKIILEQLLLGEIEILIGTHALIEKNVEFKNLGLVVIDEQHRFGVEQRARLWEKNNTPPHVLVMTATPIPRTLAMTVYGDLDTSVIKQMPPGRKPITTHWFTDSSRLRIFQLMRDEIAKGRQVYIVYPLIEESETLDYKDLMDGYESISRAFPLPQYRVSAVHGRMKPDAKEYEMQRFVKGETHIMIATTVIEVGVNVPNASMIVIESAERFGLSQLHQLRGRVGRGEHASSCLLVTGNKLSTEAKQRMKTLVATTDGFEIAEVDLKMRGPGDIEGTQQSGILNLRLADISKDQKILQEARITAQEILEQDPHLQQPDNFKIKQHMLEVKKETKKWSKIS